MAKSRVDQIAEKGLKKLEVWYKVHTQKKHNKDTSLAPEKEAEGKTLSQSASPDMYYHCSYPNKMNI